MTSEISVDMVADRVVLVTLRRPERRNALSIALRDGLSDTLDALANDDAVSVVIITGEGPVFCAGFDLKEFETAAADPAFDRALWASSDRYHATLLQFPLPLIAAVNGPAIAGGFDLAVCCDLRIASTTTVFSHPEFAWGDVVYSPLHELVGGAIARELVLTGRSISAHEALALHLVSRVVTPETVVEVALDHAKMMTQSTRELLRRSKAKILARAAITNAATLEL
ncbi:MAG: enoyl-CoA hydratase/isomerase family protein [Acidimicrobiales bacterium]